MGKGLATRHQKFKKTEKNKIKLKAKKELPKGTNVTNTTFKVKKIILRDQIKSSKDGLLSKTKLSIKELLSRLSHFNTSARSEALNGLKDLIASHQDEALANHLGQLLKGIVPLVLDREKNVRRESYKLLHMILVPLSKEKIAPFFDILCSYLRCAMTHIDTIIHEDSLLYFDILLEHIPELVVVDFHKILPSFLDMISKLRVNSRPGRMLMVNLGSKMTSVKWRTKVLSRLHQFLQVLVNIRSAQNEVDHNVSKKSAFIESPKKYNKSDINYFPIYRNVQEFKPMCFSKEKNVHSVNENEEEKWHSYIESLVPLLFETWLEVRPSSVNEAKKVEAVLTEEAVLLLTNISDIFLLLWNIACSIEVIQKNTDLTKWFVNKYKNDFSSHIFSSFPYMQSPHRNKQRVTIITNNNTDERCLQENLSICYIVVIISSKYSVKASYGDVDKVFDYLHWVLKVISSRNENCQLKFVDILNLIFESDQWFTNKNINSLLEALMLLYWELDTQDFLRHKMFKLLCNILLNNNLKELQQTNSFQSWLCDLSNVLCGPDTITSESFDAIYHIAIKNSKLFNDSMKNKLMFYVTKLPTLKIEGISDDTVNKQRLISLLYWIRQWDTESLNVLQDQLATQSYEPDIKDYLIDILKFRTDGMFL